MVDCDYCKARDAQVRLTIAGVERKICKQCHARLMVSCMNRMMGATPDELFQMKCTFCGGKPSIYSKRPVEKAIGLWVSEEELLESPVVPRCTGCDSDLATFWYGVVKPQLIGEGKNFDLASTLEQGAELLREKMEQRDDVGPVMKCHFCGKETDDFSRGLIELLAGVQLPFEQMARRSAEPHCTNCCLKLFQITDGVKADLKASGKNLESAGVKEEAVELIKERFRSSAHLPAKLDLDTIGDEDNRRKSDDT